MWQSKKKAFKESLGCAIHYSNFSNYPKSVQTTIKREFPKFNPKKTKIIYGAFNGIAFFEQSNLIEHIKVNHIELWNISVGYSENEDILFISDLVNFRLSDEEPKDFWDKE